MALVQLKSSTGSLMSHRFYDATDRPAIVFPPNSSLRLAQKAEVLTSASELLGHYVLTEVSGHVWSGSKGLLTFLGSLYKEVTKTTPGTLVYRFKRQTAKKKYFSLPKTLCHRV